MLGTASVHPRKTKHGLRYYVSWREGPEGARIQKTETVPGFGREAHERAIERAKEIREGRYYKAPPQTVGAFLSAWLERQANQVKPVTLERKKTALRAMGVLSERDAIGAASEVGREPRGKTPASASLSESPLDRLSVADLRAAHAALARKAPRQAQIALAAFKEALREAEEDGQRFDPALLKVKPNRYQSREPSFLTWEQVTELESWMPEYVRRIVPIAALTGAREGELFDLKESDLDLDKGIMRIRSGKTQASTRSVNLPATAVQLFREQLLAKRVLLEQTLKSLNETQRQIRRLDERLRRAHPERIGHIYRRLRAARAKCDRLDKKRAKLAATELVFPAPGGERWAANNFLNRVFNPARERAGMEDVVMHSLRHTFASLMGAAGVDVATIASQLGHKDGGALLLRRYRHLFAHEAPEAASKLDALVRGSEEEREEEAR